MLHGNITSEYIWSAKKSCLGMPRVLCAYGMFVLSTHMQNDGGCIT